MEPLFESAHQKWLRGLELLLIFVVEGQAAALRLVDEWLAEVLPIIAGSAGPGAPNLTLSVPKSPGGLDVRPLRVPRGGTFAAAGGEMDEVAGGFAHVRVSSGEVVTAFMFQLWGVPSGPGEEQPGVELRLTCPLWDMPHEVFEQVLCMADSFVGQARLVYGQVGQNMGGRSALLRAHPAALGSNQGWRMRQLQGYDWVTYVPAGLASQIAPQRWENAGQSLFSVRRLGDWTTRLQATETAEDYDLEAVRHMFLTLVDILPEGVPVPEPTGWPERPWRALMIVYEGAADHR